MDSPLSWIKSPWMNSPPNSSTWMNSPWMNSPGFAQKKAWSDPFADMWDNQPVANDGPLLPQTISCEEELARYKALRVPSSNSQQNPVVFWRDNAAAYPLLAHTARRVFCILASSAQSERDFSSVGHAITDMRSRLSAEKVEAIEMIRWGMPGYFQDFWLGGYLKFQRGYNCYTGGLGQHVHFLTCTPKCTPGGFFCKNLTGGGCKKIPGVHEPPPGGGLEISLGGCRQAS